MLQIRSIKTKVLLSFIVVLALFMASIMLIIIPRAVNDYEEDLENNLINLIEFASANSITALEFEDHSYAADIFKSSKDIAEITHFGISKNDKKEFYHFSRDSIEIPELSDFPNIVFTDDYIFISKPLITYGDLLGYIFIMGTKKYVNEKVNSFIIQIFYLLIAILIIIYFLVKQVQKEVVKPIINLSTIARTVQNTGDYNIDVAHKSEDEIGLLFKHFREMMSTINEKTLEIKHQNEHLEDRIEERTKEYELAKDDAEKANKLKSIFLANMSHEIRTPLNAILGYTQVLKETIKKSENVEKINIISSSGKHLLHIINEILDMSKIEAGKMTIEYTDICLDEFLTNVVYMLQVKAEEKQLKLNIQIDDSTPKYFNSDMAKLRQAMINIIGNAIKFTKVGDVTVRTFMDNEMIYFEIADTGVGMSEEFLNSVFEPFRQGENEPGMGGTGLGMAITKKLSELLSGDLTVTSELGKGSTFTFSVPYIEAKAAVKTVKKIQNITIDGTGKHVLIVDDVIVNRKLLEDILSPLGFKNCTGRKWIESCGILSNT